MRTILAPALALILWISAPVCAFDTVDEQIDHYLDILENGSLDSQVEMLKRLQWSGLSDKRLYDAMKFRLNYRGMMPDRELNKPEKVLIAHMIRALGYSGNERYRGVLVNLRDYSKNKKFSSHAAKALVQLDRFESWNQLVAESDLKVESKPVEIETYMKMLDTDDVMVQRLAARAIFHERRNDPELLAMAAEKLDAMYLRAGLDREAQDTLAWLVKAVGENANRKYPDLLGRVAKETPYKNVRKHATRYLP